MDEIVVLGEHGPERLIVERGSSEQGDAGPAPS
jgi:hypothetical protein